MGNPVLLAVVVIGEGKVKFADNELDARTLLSSPPPGELVFGICITGEVAGVLVFTGVGLVPRSLSLKYFARFRRDAARVGSFSDASLLALFKTSASTCPTDDVVGDEVEGPLRRCAKMPPLSTVLWSP